MNCYKNGKIPLMNIGPDLSFCVGLMLLVGFVLFILIFISLQILWNVPLQNRGKIDPDKEPNVTMFVICITLIARNLITLFNAMLGE